MNSIAQSGNGEKNGSHLMSTTETISVSSLMCATNVIQFLHLEYGYHRDELFYILEYSLDSYTESVYEYQLKLIGKNNLWPGILADEIHYTIAFLLV